MNMRCLLNLGLTSWAVLTPTVWAEGPGRTLLVGDYQKKLLAVVRPDNTVAWSQPIKSIHDAHRLANGNILFQSSFHNVIEVAPDGKEVWRYDAKPAAGEKVEIHAFQRLADGSTMVAESGRARIIEVSPSGQILRTVPLKVEHPHHHKDTRLVRKLTTGNYLVAHEADHAVREYDPMGQIVWSFTVGASVYSAERLANGHTLIGAGDGHAVREVDPAGKIVWAVEEKDLPGITLAWVTMVERRPNGNTLIVNCHAGPENPQMIEVSPDKKVVWTFKDFDRFGNATPVGRILD